MKSQIFNISINDNIVDYTTEHILNISKYDIEFSNIAVVTPSKRQSLFIKKRLAEKLKISFLSPMFFTIDELVKCINNKNAKKKYISNIDSVYLLYKILKEKIKSYEFSSLSFSEFFDWGNEILNFINSLDVEKIDNSKLLNLKLKADIGYDLPKNINVLLRNLHDIRKEFHNRLDLLNKTTIGYSFYNAYKYVSKFFKNNKRVILSNVYYLNKSEIDIFKILYDEAKLDIIIKGNATNWVALKKIYEEFNCNYITEIKDSLKNDVDIYSTYDGQTQACLVKKLILNIPLHERKNTVVIVPDNSVLQSVMSELYYIEKDINVAVGYPITKTTVFSLLFSIIQAIKNKNKDKYYVKDIIDVISNPLVKNLRFVGKPEVTRIIVHEIVKNFDRFNNEALFKGYKFISVKEITDNEFLCENISKKISLYWEQVSTSRIKKLISEMFDLFIINFSNSVTMKMFSESIKAIADNISYKSLINKYSFNIGAINILYTISGNFYDSICSNENFDTKEILNIFETILRKNNINLIGSPLKGLQVLGLMETRGLNFDNVFILSMTDSVIPSISEINSLIPKEISDSLGIGYIGREIDIQKYHFMSLISGAKKVSLIYPKSNNNIKSRFIEEIIWNKQLKEKNLQVGKVVDTFITNSASIKNNNVYIKNDKIKKYLSDFSYSATNINTYMQCKLKFYYQYVLRLTEKTDFDNEYEYIDIGNCIHDFLKEIFYPNLIHDKLMDKKFKNNYDKILDKYLNNYFKNSNNGKTFLLKKLIKNKMDVFYNNEKNRDFKKILASELDTNSTINVNGKNYKLISRIDRIDENNDGTLTIIDYKTGKIENPISSRNFIDNTKFTREIVVNNIKSFQLIIYKYLYEKKTGKKISNCILYSLKNSNIVKLFKNNENKENLYVSALKQLKYIISEINDDEPFKREIYDNVNCEKCPYFYLCRE